MTKQLAWLVSAALKAVDYKWCYAMFMMQATDNDCPFCCRANSIKSYNSKFNLTVI